MNEQGGPILKEAQTRPISRGKETEYKRPDTRNEIVMEKDCLQRWKTTGVIALADCNLKVFHDDLGELHYTVNLFCLYSF